MLNAYGLNFSYVILKSQYLFFRLLGCLCDSQKPFFIDCELCRQKRANRNLLHIPAEEMVS